MNKQEMQNEIENLEEAVGYWEGLFHEEEHEVMRLRGELEEVKQERDGHESEAYDRDRILVDLLKALEEAETLEDFKEIVEDEYGQYSMYGIGHYAH